jgi:hypothetical protein
MAKRNRHGHAKEKPHAEDMQDWRVAPESMLLTPAQHAEAAAAFDAFAAYANETFAAREEIVANPRMREKLFDLARKAREADAGSERGARKKKELAELRRVALTPQLIAALKAKGAYMVFWDGQKFLHTKACEQLAEDLNEEKEKAIATRSDLSKAVRQATSKDTLSASTIGGYTRKQLENWTLADYQKEAGLRR